MHPSPEHRRALLLLGPLRGADLEEVRQHMQCFYRLTESDAEEVAASAGTAMALLITLQYSQKGRNMDSLKSISALILRP